jgi:hypothetical protein
LIGLSISTIQLLKLKNGVHLPESVTAPRPGASGSPLEASRYAGTNSNYSFNVLERTSGGRVVVQPANSSECAPVCATMALEDLGVEIGRRQARNLGKTTGEGTILQDLANGINRKVPGIDATWRATPTFQGAAKAVEQGDRVIAGVKLADGTAHAIVIDEVASLPGRAGRFLGIRDPLGQPFGGRYYISESEFDAIVSDTVTLSRVK